MSKPELMQRLYGIGAIKFGKFKLKSGKDSPYYIDLRILPSHVDVLRQVGNVMWDMIFSSSEKVDILCGIPAAGLAIADVTSYVSSIPVISTRKEPIVYKDLAAYFQKIVKEGKFKLGEEEHMLVDEDTKGLQTAITIVDSLSGLKTHGISRYVDGDLKDGARIGLVDDLITDAGSKLEARDLILLDAKRRGIDVSIVGVYVLLDREQGGREALQREGLQLYSVATIREAAKWLQELGTLTPQMYATIVDYTIADRKAMGLE